MHFLLLDWRVCAVEILDLNLSMPFLWEQWALHGRWLPIICVAEGRYGGAAALLDRSFLLQQVHTGRLPNLRRYDLQVAEHGLLA